MSVHGFAGYSLCVNGGMSARLESHGVEGLLRSRHLFLPSDQDVDVALYLRCYGLHETFPLRSLGTVPFFRYDNSNL